MSDQGLFNGKMIFESSLTVNLYFKSSATIYGSSDTIYILISLHIDDMMYQSPYFYIVSFENTMSSYVIL
jgi:hypothetical protein